LREFI